MIKCNRCNGTGQWMDIGGVLKKCPDCKGTGRILDEAKEEKAEYVPRGTIAKEPSEASKAHSERMKAAWVKRRAAKNA